MEAFISPMALLPTGAIGRFDDYMNEDPALEGMASVGFERERNTGGPGSERSWGGVSNSTTTYEHGDRERERNARRRKNRQRDSYYSNRVKMGVGPGAGQRRGRGGEEDFFTVVGRGGGGGGGVDGGEEFRNRDGRDGFHSPSPRVLRDDLFRGF